MGIRKANPEELRYEGRALSLRDDFAEALAVGHVIHGYSSASSIRMLMILATRDYSDSAPLLGFGTGPQTDVALRRTRDTYARRIAEGLDFITERQYPEATSGLLTGGQINSTLDSIVWGGSLKIFQEDAEVVAWSQYGPDLVRGPVEGRGEDAQAAVNELTALWGR
jgi:hypothetical protein